MSMDIVDAQVHVGSEGFAPTLAQMDALGIRAVMLDEFWFRNAANQQMPGYELPGGAWRCVSPIAEQAALLHPDRFSYLLRVSRQDPGLPSLLQQLKYAPHARALRLQPLSDIQAFGAGAYGEMFELAQDAGLPVFVFLQGQVAHLTRYLRDFPRLNFIVDHCGMPWSQTNVAYFDEVLKLAAYPNAALKWAHAQHLFSVEEYPYRPLLGHLRRAIDAFGPERVIWASDHSTVKGHSWGELLFYLRDAPELSAKEKEWILGGALRRIVDWPKV
jgi:L-fuconolactonase